jgi:hypothetical protein
MELFSKAYVTSIAANSGINIGEARVDDDSVDITFSTRPPKGRAKLDIQLKSTSQIPDTRNRTGDFPFELSLKNYDDLRPSTKDLLVRASWWFSLCRETQAG